MTLPDGIEAIAAQRTLLLEQHALRVAISASTVLGKGI